ncbi:MAG TPA: VOC family protein [Chloroflexia bacterium]|nr:VOC family protein [Chloroflexia bacterium]
METTEEIYPMPAFPVLNVTDLAASSRWYQEALGFRNVFTMAGPGGVPLLVHLRWVKYADVLLAARPVPPGPRGLGIVLSFSAYLSGRSVDEIAAQAAAYGATIVAPPEPKPWNTRECTIADPDGFQLTFTEPVNMHRSFDEVIQEAAKAEVGER